MPGNTAQTDRKHLVTIILAFAAVYFIWGTTYLVIRLAIETIPPFSWPVRASCSLLAPILWSLGSLYSRGADLPQDTFMSTAIEMLAGGVLLLLAGLLTGEASGLNVAQFSTRSLVAFAYLTIFGSIIAFTAYIWLLKYVPPTKVATYTYVNPVIAVFLGWLILSEPVTATTIVSVVIIVLAVILITTGGPGREPAKKSINRPANRPQLTIVPGDNITRP